MVARRHRQAFPFADMFANATGCHSISQPWDGTTFPTADLQVGSTRECFEQFVQIFLSHLPAHAERRTLS